MKSAFILALVCPVLGAVVPQEDTRSSWSDPVITRPFTLPPLPWPTAFPWPPAKREAEPTEGQDIEERDVFGSGPDPTKVQITGVTYGGTGCPGGSVGSAISDDRTIMTLIFDQYVASIGGDAPVAQRRKNCQLNLSLKYPGGFQYSILSADYRGYAYMDKGVTGKQQSTYYFSGQTAQTSTGTTWVGPFDQTYLIHDTAASASLIWSPCGDNAMLNINSQVQLTSSNSSGIGYLTTDSIDTAFTQMIYIQWQPCKASSTKTKAAA